jgi:hypothetical protein
MSKICKSEGCNWPVPGNEDLCEDCALLDAAFPPPIDPLPSSGQDAGLREALLGADTLLAYLVSSASKAPKGLRLKLLVDGIVRVRDFLARSAAASLQPPQDEMREALIEFRAAYEQWVEAASYPSAEKDARLRLRLADDRASAALSIPSQGGEHGL